MAQGIGEEVAGCALCRADVGGELLIVALRRAEVGVCLLIMAHRAGRRSASTLAPAGSGAVVWDGRPTECQCSEGPMSLHAANYSICQSSRRTGINPTSLLHITPPFH